MSLIVTLDGPAASGKSTVARLCAEKIDGIVIYSGRFYRLITWLLVYMGWDENLASLDCYLEKILVADRFSWRETEHQAILLYEGADLSHHLETQMLDVLIGGVAAAPSVRNFINCMLRLFASTKLYRFFEGRDMGSVVFPQADLKIFLTASPIVRAKRRADQRGAGHTSNVISLELKARDEQDRTRSISPLMPGEGAWMLDTSNLTLDDTVIKILDKIQNFLHVEE